MRRAGRHRTRGRPGLPGRRCGVGQLPHQAASGAGLQRERLPLGRVSPHRPTITVALPRRGACGPSRRMRL